MYRAVRRAFFLVPAERIHTWVFTALRTGTVPDHRRPSRLEEVVGADTIPCLASTVFGVRFPGPMGLAAGFDKNGAGLAAWGALGFGYAEVGTVTAQAQPGNPPPRMFRLPAGPGAAQPAGFQQPRRGRARAAAGAAHARCADRGEHRQNQSRARPTAPSTTTGKARGWSVRWRPTWLSTSARRTLPGCVTCRPSSRCGRSLPQCQEETSHTRPRQDRPGPVRLRCRRDRRSGSRIGPCGHRRDQHDDVP